MILIAHRGNRNGPNPKMENRPSYLWETLYKGYQVEADVWYDGGWWLGHDEPKYKATKNDLFHFWCHAKSPETMEWLMKRHVMCYFWQDKDDYTLTSNGYVICHSKVQLIKNGVCMMPEMGYKGNLKNCSALCSDFIEKYDKTGNIRR